MKQIIQSYKTGEIRIEEVPMPSCNEGGVLVKNACSLISLGTEKLIVKTGQKSLLCKAISRPDLVKLAWEKAKKEGFLNVFKESQHRLDEPVPLGYSCAGVVTEVGEGVADFAVGDKVACAGAGFASHAEYVWVPENVCVHIPDNLSFKEAQFVTVGAIALHGVRCAELRHGEVTAVIGLGLLGLITIQILTSYGCKVVCFDIDEKKCDLAEKTCENVFVAKDIPSFRRLSGNISKGCGTDAVIITAAGSDSKPILAAEDVCRKRGTIVLVGVADISLTRSTMWEKELKFVVSKGAGPGSNERIYEKKGYHYPIEWVRWTENRNMEEFLSLVVQKKVDVNSLVTHSFKIQDALDAYDAILKGKQFCVGVSLDYEENISPHTKVLLASSYSKTNSTKTIGLIGGGLFTKNVLLPNLMKLGQMHLGGIATTSGHTSFHVAKKFGFRYATTDYRKIIEDEEIDSIIISTPHNLHAKMVIEALTAGKNVFVEKPLCINKTQLHQIADVYDSLERKPRIMVGFNRPFSLLSKKAKMFLEDRTTPLVLHYRVNAGYIEPDHWTQDLEVGGGRIVGEVCHFIDFLQFFAKSYPESVFSEGIANEAGKYLRDDNVIITLKFRDGSVGSILYSAKGTKAFSRERVEMFCEKSVVVIEDFKKLSLIGEGKRKVLSRFSQDIGYANELKSFVDSQKYDPKVFEGYIHTMLATFAAVESLRTGMPVKIDEE